MLVTNTVGKVYNNSLLAFEVMEKPNLPDVIINKETEPREDIGGDKPVIEVTPPVIEVPDVTGKNTTEEKKTVTTTKKNNKTLIVATVIIAFVLFFWYLSKKK